MSQNEEKQTELDTGLCYADLSPGDRIYGPSMKPTFGIVIYSDESMIQVGWDDLRMTMFQRGIRNSLNQQLKGYGKPLNLRQVEKGSIISRKYPGQPRVYAEVMAYAPGEFLSYWYLKDSSALVTVRQDKKQTLEERMMYWELEG